jgi:hypothetical protein
LPGNVLETGPRLAILIRGGETFIGQESGVTENPGLRYPARVAIQFVQARIQGSHDVSMQAVALPILLPTPFMPLNDGERLSPVGGDDRDYLPTANIIGKYLGVLGDALKQSEAARQARPRLAAR